jgi:putative nucleotidyltransferase with HDIG domain
VRALDDSPAVAAVRAGLASIDPQPAAWIVGGTVRDALIGREPIDDVDVAIDGDAHAAAEAIRRETGGPIFRLSDTFRSYRAIAPDRSWTVDITPLQGPTIEDDLRNRDFAINAIAVPVTGGDPIDPTGGLADVDRRVLRVLPGAYERDPLRPLRLARLAAELDLAPDPDTERATREAAPRLTEAAPERVFAELRRLVTTDRVLDGLDLADSLGIVRAVIPELADLHGVEQSHFHHADVHGHTLEVLQELIGLEGELERVFGDELAQRIRAVMDEPLADELTRGQALRFAALLHDIGKPQTRGVRDDGRVTFIGHDAVGQDLIGDITKRLRTSTALREFLGRITRHHLALGFLVHERPLSRAAVYRYLRKTDPVAVETTILTCADRLATRGRNAEEAIAKHLDLARELMAEALDYREHGPPKPPVRGDVVARELGIDSGPEIGALVERLREAAFTGEATTEDEALQLARRLRDNPER